MKHIKAFEKIKISKSGLIIRYNIGDYILLKEYKINPWNIDRKCQITDVTTIDRFGFLKSDYEILSYHKNIKTMTNSWVAQKDIQRKLKPEEIEEFLLQKDTLKYNL